MNLINITDSMVLKVTIFLHLMYYILVLKPLLKGGVILAK